MRARILQGMQHPSQNQIQPNPETQLSDQMVHPVQIHCQVPTNNRQHWIASQESHDGQVEAALHEIEVAEEERDVEEHQDVAADHLGEVDLDWRVALVAEAPGGPEEEVVAAILLFDLGLFLGLAKT